METSLHRQLKERFVPVAADREVTVDGYRIDGVLGETLVEIQRSSLGAMRDKARALLERHSLRIVKPITVRNYLVTLERRKGEVVSSRYSPQRGSIQDLFEDLVHFVGPFPHPRLQLEVILIEQEEHRVRRTGKRRWREKNYRTIDRRLRDIGESLTLRTPADLLRLLPKLPNQFTTREISEQAGMPRWLAQKAAYVLRETEAIEQIGREGNALVYRIRQKAAAA